MATNPNTDNFNTWYQWDDNGHPVGNPITPQLDIGTYDIPYCDGVIEKVLTITLKLYAVDFFITYENGIPIYNWNQKVIATCSPAPTQDVNILILSAERVGDGYIDPTDPWGALDVPFYTLEMLNGQTTSTISTWTPLEVQPQDDNAIAIQRTLYTNDGKGVICAPPPAECTLEITGTTITPESTNGANDGTITIFVSGSTGTTFYTLDALSGSSQASNVFTGLGTGTYSVEATEGDCFDQVTGLFVAEGEFRSGEFTVVECADFVASENPIVTTLSTALRASPAFAQTTFTIGSSIVDDSAVVFDLTEPIAYTATFTSKDFPNRSNYFVSPTLRDRGGNAIGVNSNAEIAVGLGESLSNDINLSRWFFIDVDSNVVTLTAKEATARMTLDTSNVTVGTGIVMDTVTEGVDAFDGSFISNYSLYNDIYVGDSTIEFGETLSSQNYDNWSLLELPYAQDNTHRFDVQEIMKTFVSTPKIDLTFTGFTVISDVMRPFYVKYGESYPLVANENTKKKRQKGETGYKWVINGAVDFEDANDVTGYTGVDAGGGIRNDVPFLTNSPNPLQIQRDSQQFLYFLLSKDYGVQLDVRGDIVFYDGTELNNQIFFVITTGGTNQGGVYCLNVSYESLGLAAYEASGNTKIKRVTFAVWQGSGSSAFSDEKIYRFEIDEQPRKFGVSFLNKKGGFDIFDFVGVVEDSIVRKNKIYTIPRDIQSDGSSLVGFKSSAMFDTTVIKTVTVNSGWIDEVHFDWLIELMNTNDIYSYTEPNQNYLKVKKYKYKKSSLDDLFELEVVFEQTIIENNVTV